MPIQIFFRVLRVQRHRCSLRVQAYRPNRAFTLTACVFQIVARASISESQNSQSVAGFGAVGPVGPRVGNSSGVLPGNSSGLGASPGSRIGGGTSGRGFPGGLSFGGSVGRPGLIGGSSCGSIGISFFPATPPLANQRPRGRNFPRG